jgi:RNA polymerase sigma factor (sigma-70 family)
MALGLHRGEDLEDVLQNVYLEAHKSFADLRDPQAGLAWLFTIGRRQYARYVALRVRRRRLFADVAPDDERGAGEAGEARPAAVDERLVTGGLCGQVFALMDQVENPTRRLALQLFFLEDLSLKEIAARTATNVSTLTTWISRFRQQAQARIGALDDVDAASPRLVREVSS